MIRLVALFLGLSLGLCAALLFGGSLGHLRLAGLPLPAWVAGIDDSAGLAEGQGTLAGAALHWRLDGLSGFDVSLGGSDWQARGRAGPQGMALRIADVTGLVPLSLLGLGEGVLAIEAGTVLAGLDGLLREGRLEGQARGSDPAGPVVATWNDGWTLASR